MVREIGERAMHLKAQAHGPVMALTITTPRFTGAVAREVRAEALAVIGAGRGEVGTTQKLEQFDDLVKWSHDAAHLQSSSSASELRTRPRANRLAAGPRGAAAPVTRAATLSRNQPEVSR